MECLLSKAFLTAKNGLHRLTVVRELKLQPRGAMRSFSRAHAYHIHYLLVVFVIQCVLTFTSLRLYFSDFKGAERIVAAGAYVVPLVGYFAALWTSQLFKRYGLILRALFVIALSITALAGASFAIGICFYYFGVPL
jgi:hypothetical protein